MSRIGNRLLSIPEGVEVTLEPNNTVIVKGPKGELSQKFSPLITIEIDQESRTVKTLRANEIKHTKQLHGTTNSLIAGMLEGVSKGFEKNLQIVGVGYKANLNGKKLGLSLGFSHPVECEIPEGLTVEVPKPTNIIIRGINKQLVGEFAANIRAYRKPEPYKGKGIKYADEKIIRKEGKAAGK
ncbi:large subunit ribosomal protein L6 [Entomoplasma freundtii]|uniref:Large ribosomal subunit protein uL6 n=1 Tax=Entomoplasma freundtii TaxID=74700 RepID=A0A2K8NQW1_9MOLU|nr:50S ribosomal protein L6 [Entomoplasma freundtii]ATZ16174.1 50S ribosomal protein L6 [Entomoplasma freundtii]TDY56925.1 large subunit ribosomal protein L6 [Entomoplasma freundtii]